MEYDKENAIEVLKRTPATLKVLLSGISDQWLHADEGPGSWSPKEVIAHLILGEKTDWIPRANTVLNNDSEQTFTSFDMTSHIEYSKNRSLDQLLSDFKFLREENLIVFKSFDLSEENLSKTAIHPEFGRVTLKQHLATWVAHDLGHIVQITRVMAKQYKTEVGPWVRYLSVLNN